MTKVDECKAAALAYDIRAAGLHGYLKEWAKHDTRDAEDMARLREQIGRADAAWDDYQRASQAMSEEQFPNGDRVADLSDFGEPVF